MSEVGVLLPLRLETRFRDGDLHVRVIPDEPWFARDDQQISDGELAALTRYVESVDGVADPEAVQVAWRELAAHLGGARAVSLHRWFVTTDADGAVSVREPNPDERRTEPVLPRFVGFPERLVVWLVPAGGTHRAVLELTVDRTRLLADFADPDVPGDRRWWEDWDEALAVGVAGIVPGSELGEPIDALYVTGLGDAKPGELFASLTSEGRLGLLRPGTPTNTVEGSPAAPLANDPATWWSILHATAGETDADVSGALTGDPGLLGPLPGGDSEHRQEASALVTVLWPALWGFAAGHVWNVARGAEPAAWARGALFPEGPYPTLRVGSQPYGLLPTTSWQRWERDADDPGLEVPLVNGLLRLREGHAERARARGTVADGSVDKLMDLIGQTPTSSRFRYRLAWPLELWWLAIAASGLRQPWRTFASAWNDAHPLVGRLQLDHIRRYGTRGRARLIGIPLVVPLGTPEGMDVATLLRNLADVAPSSPSEFADTARLESTVLGWRADSLLLRLAIRSLQLLIADIARERDGIETFDPEPVSRRDRERGRVEELVRSVGSIDVANPTPAVERLLEATAALRALAAVPVEQLARMLCAAVDSSSHRIDPWLVGVAERRLGALRASGSARFRLGAYGWVDAPAPGTPGPTAGGLLTAPSAGQALVAAVLRDRAVNDPGDPRWDLDITSRRARIAERVAQHVRVGAHLSEALGREIERIVARTPDVARLRRDFPVRTEHAGRRVCDGLKVLAQDPFPVALDAEQEGALAELRQAIDTYGDLLVADAVLHLSEGRSEVAGAVMDGAAGLSRPPELALLRTPREGRAVASSVVIVLPNVEAPEIPAEAAERALLSPTTVLDPSTAAFIATQAGDPGVWDLIVDRLDDAGQPAGTSRTVTLAELELDPADALALTRTDLERVAAETAGELLGVDPRSERVAVVGGSAGARYEAAGRLVGTIGQSPAGRGALAERSASEDDGGAAVVLRLATRFLAARRVAAALAAQLRRQVERLAGDGTIGTADPALLGRLVGAARAWGIAPDPPSTVMDGAASATEARLRRLAAVAVRALPQLEERLAAAPSAPADVRALGRDELVAATVALASPTGQLAVTGDLAASALPALGRSDLDAEWLTVVAAVRPALARLELHQLAGGEPLVAWTNRAGDPWQQDPGDPRRLVAVYAAPGLDLGAAAPSGRIAVGAVDRFSEVIPAQEQHAGAAFGFDAPAARAQQAILLAVPPVVEAPLDDDTLIDVLIETRELAHARMARPLDLAGETWGLAPTALLPATGSAATPLEPIA
jgi:hypothetical protein